MRLSLRSAVLSALSVLFPPVVVTCFLAPAVHAEQRPHSAGFDPQVQVVVYNPHNVVRLVGSPTKSTQVIFSADEEITQVSIGDESGWLAQPAGNLLFIKPLAVRERTNMQVVTRRADATRRSYQFRLISTRRDAIYAVSFSYPDDEEKARSDRLAAEASAKAETAATEKLAGAWAEGPRNWRYVAQGSKLIEPVEVSDNGRQTAFRFPGNMRLPTLYTAAPDGAETIVPYTMVGDLVVVQTAAAAFTLRDGKEVLRIVNRGFDPVGRDPGTGTGLPDLRRIVKDAPP